MWTIVSRKMALPLQSCTCAIEMHDLTSLYSTNTRYVQYSKVREYRLARQAIWVVQVVHVASDECGCVTVRELIQGFFQLKRALVCRVKSVNCLILMKIRVTVFPWFLPTLELSYYCSFVKERLYVPPTFGPISCLGLNLFNWLSTHPGASIVWPMSAHVEFEKHIPSAMDIWGKKLRVLYLIEGYYKAALCRQT